MRASQSRGRSYADEKRIDLEFAKGDHVFVRMTPTTGFIGPNQILRQVGLVAYQVALPPHLSCLHDVLHVSQLRKYMPDPTHVVALDDVQLKNNLTFGVSPLRIVDRRVKQLRNKEVALVKVLWDQRTEVATWELVEQIRELYPELFTGS